MPKTPARKKVNPHKATNRLRRLNQKQPKLKKVEVRRQLRAAISEVGEEKKDG